MGLAEVPLPDARSSASGRDGHGLYLLLAFDPHGAPRARGVPRPTDGDRCRPRTFRRLTSGKPQCNPEVKPCLHGLSSSSFRTETSSTTSLEAPLRRSASAPAKGSLWAVTGVDGERVVTIYVEPTDRTSQLPRPCRRLATSLAERGATPIVDARACTRIDAYHGATDEFRAASRFPDGDVEYPSTLADIVEGTRIRARGTSWRVRSIEGLR